MDNDKTKSNYTHIKTLKSFFEKKGYVVEYSDSFSSIHHYKYAYYIVRHKDLDCPSFRFSDDDWGTFFTLQRKDGKIMSGCPVIGITNMDNLEFFVNEDKQLYNALMRK